MHVATREGETCALLESGSLRCWGNNFSDNEEVDVDGKGSKVLQISSSYFHTCVVLEGGRVRCWGWNSYGELGTNNTNWATHPSRVSQDIDVDGFGTPVVLVRAGGHKSCALLETAQVRCWGWSGNSILGANSADGVLHPATLPKNIDVDGEQGLVVELQATGPTVCVLMHESRLRCWNDGRNGERAASQVANPPSEFPDLVIDGGGQGRVTQIQIQGPVD